MHEKYKVSIWNSSKAINFYPYIWPLTLNDDIDLLHLWLYGIYLYSKYEVSIISCSKVKGYVKFVNFEFNWLLALKDDLDLDKSPAQNMHLHEIHVQAKKMKFLSVMAQSVMAQKLWPYVKISDLTYMYILTFDINDIHLSTSPLKMCGFMRYICILNMEAIHWRMKKLSNLTKKVNQLIYMFIWPLTLEDETDLNKSPLRMCGSMIYTCKSNMEAIHWRMKK